MKKFYLLGILLYILLSSKSVLAQETQLAIKFGSNYSSFSGDKSSNYNGIIGIHAGILVNYVFNDRIAIETSMLFSQKGAKAKNDSESITLKYMDFPLLFKYSINQYINIHAGGQVSPLLFAEDENDNLINELFKETDFGFALGTEYKFDFGLAFSIRYITSLSSITNGPISYSGNNEKLNIKNSVLQFSVNYYFISYNN